jgi:hypothetical protein
LNQHDDHPHVPGPSLWPVGFAIGVVVLMIGLIVSWWIAGLGAALLAAALLPEPAVAAVPLVLAAWITCTVLALKARS